VTVPDGPPRRTPFWGLLVSFFVSEVGTAMSAVAIPWLVLITTGSAGRTGVVVFAEMTPYVLLQATAGPLADRIGWRLASSLGNLAAAVAVGVLPLLHGLDLLGFPTLIVLVALAGIARGIADAANNPLVPGTAALAQMSMERAAGLYSSANRAGLLIGMPAAGALITVTSASTVIFFDALSFAAAAVGIFVLVPAAVQSERPDEPLSLHAYRDDLVDGVRFLRRDRLLVGIVLMVTMTNLLDEALISVLLPVWSRDRLHSPTGVGAAGAAFGFGALCGVVMATWLAQRLPRRMTFALCYLLGGAAPFFALAACSTLAPIVIVIFVANFFGGFLNPILGAVSYERVPARMQARVLGVFKASAWVGIPIGAVVGGVLAEYAGLRGALIGTGVVMFVVTLAPFVFPAWRQMDRDATPTPVAAIQS
jgi:MFS family permease